MTFEPRVEVKKIAPHDSISIADRHGRPSPACSRNGSFDNGYAPKPKGEYCAITRTWAVKNERSDSYSSVKEDVGGLPQSFLVSPKRRSIIGKPGAQLDDYEDAVSDDFLESASLKVPAAGKASLGDLPIELLEKIVARLTVDVPSTEYEPRNRDIISCLLTSRTISAATVRVLYRHITLPHSLVFSKFLNQITKQPELGAMVRRFDLSHFSSVGMGRTRQSDQEIQNLTSRTLVKCLEAMPRVNEVLLQTHVEQDVDTYVLKKLFYSMPHLKALDLCASSIANFRDSFTNAVSGLTAETSLTIGLQRLCLHECSTLQSRDLTTLLGRLPDLTVLDLYHTRITDKALETLPHSARLTHLNIGRCPGLSAPGVLEFLISHPAARSLVWLNLSCDISRFRLLDDADVGRLLPALPGTLRSLNLNGAKIQPRHLPLLAPLTKHLEELGLGHSELSLTDIATFFCPPDDSSPARTDIDTRPSTLHYLDLTGLATLTQPALVRHAQELLGPISQPLEVIEVGAKIATSLRQTPATNKGLGWAFKELGRRNWYVREPTPEPGGAIKSGDRDWKMGSVWWGMRKAPVAQGDVGGLYGHYMFKI